jgi:CheY-like chemotaxis protein
MRLRQTRSTPHPVILVLDPLDSLRQNIQKIVEDADFLVLPAANADQALELAKSCAGPSRLLTTMLHPDGMPGPDLAFRLRLRSPEMGVLSSSASPLAELEVPTPSKWSPRCCPGHSAEQRRSTASILCSLHARDLEKFLSVRGNYLLSSKDSSWVELTNQRGAATWPYPALDDS